VKPPVKGNLIRWTTSSPSMVEVEAQCASLGRQANRVSLPLTLLLEGEELPRLSELKRLFHLIDPLIQDGATPHILCESLATQRLLEFCGLHLILELNEGRAPDCKS
jgi:hypothetical protein